MASRLTIAPLRPEDYPAAAEVYLKSRHFLLDISGEAEEELGLPMVFKEAADSQAHGAVFAGIRLKKTGHMVGVAVYEPSGHEGNSGMAWLALLMIAEPYHRQGYGTEACLLLEEAIFADSRVNTIRLAVLVNNPDALSFWRRMGYRELLTRKSLDGAHEVTEMEKQR